MYRYRLYGFRMLSDLKFPQLVVEQEEMGDAPEIVIQAGEVPESIASITDKKYVFGETFSWLSNKTTWLMVEDGEKVTYCLKDGGNEMHLCTYILGFGMSMLAMQRGMLSIHCSALSNEEGAILIAGESGAGKSTVTTAFLEKGYHLMADDMALVEMAQDGCAWARPAFPFQKLCRNVAVNQGYDLEKLIYINEDKDKFLVPYQGKFDLEAVPIKAFIMLGVTENETVVVQEVAGFQRFHVYANNLFLRHLLKQEKYSPAIGQKCLEMAAAVPTYYIGRPEGKDTTKQVIVEAFRLIGEK